MQFLPGWRVSIENGWILLGFYFLGLTVMVLTYPADKRKKLFFEPAYSTDNWRWFILMVGRIAAVSFVILMFFTPLSSGTPLFILGILAYVLGFLVVMISLYTYRQAPSDRPVRRGIYQISRNPQWVGLVFVFIGSSLAVGAWLHLILVLVLIGAYHFQILLEEESCLNLYGAEYREYMRTVPRYLLI